MALAPADELVQRVAPQSWRMIDFISDLHLAEDTPLTFSAWRDYLAHTPADAVLILGDLFEVWVGDDARDEAFEALAAEVLRSATAGRSVAFMAGNRDFLVGADMLRDCGMDELADPTLLVAFGGKALLTHGDALCTGDVPYQRFRRMVRDPRWQHDFLQRPLAERRAFARELRTASEDRRSHTTVWHDVDSEAAVDLLERAHARTLVHGHTHRPGSALLALGFERHVLSDWDFDHGGAPRAEVLRWNADGFARLSLDQAVRRSP